MNKTQPAEYRKLGRYLWERINVTDNDERDSLRALNSIAFNLMETIDGEPYSGFMWELTMWIGLKRDAPEAFKDYGDKLKLEYPEFFEEALGAFSMILTPQLLHEFYAKAVLPQFDRTINDPKWYEVRELGPDEAAHIFTIARQTYILIYEDYYGLGRNPQYVCEELKLREGEFEYVNPTSYSEHSPSYRGFTPEAPYQYVEGITGSFTLLKILKI